MSGKACWLTRNHFRALGLVLAGSFSMLHAAPIPQETATEAPPATKSVEFDRESSLKSFDKVWETIDQSHWDEELVGEFWDGLKEKYRPRVEAASSMKEVRGAMQEMLEELEQSHFGIIPSNSYDAVKGKGGGQATAGLSIRKITNRAVVTRVREGSAADKAGVKIGWAVVQIAGKPVTELLTKIKAAANGPVRYETLVGLALEKRLSGTQGSSVELVLEDGNGATHQLDLKLTLPEGNLVRFGNLPPMRVGHQTRTLPGEIGYFTFNAFFDPVRVMPAYRSMLTDPKHRRGIVIDLRGNIGGIAAMTMGMASAISDRTTELGVMRMRGTKLKFAVNEAPDPVECPIAVLIDECSISSAEIMAGGFQDIGIARVFGTRSAGLALPSNVIRLPNGDGFQYAMADYRSASGKSLEKEGVIPDEQIELTQQRLLNEQDPVLNRALEWIEETNDSK